MIDGRIDGLDGWNDDMIACKIFDFMYFQRYESTYHTSRNDICK